jgi:hypothetical protein
MQPCAIRSFGRSGLWVTPSAVGTAPAGNRFQPVDGATTAAMLRVSRNTGIPSCDTDPIHGRDLAQRHRSRNLRWTRRKRSGPAFKVGCHPIPTGVRPTLNRKGLLRKDASVPA